MADLLLSNLICSDAETEWTKTPSPYYGMTLLFDSQVVGAFVIAPGTECYTGQWQYSLKALHLRSTIAPIEVLQCIGMFVQQINRAPRAWISCRVSSSSPLQDALQRLGYEATEYTLALPLARQLRERLSSSIREATERDQAEIRKLSRNCIGYLLPELEGVTQESLMVRCETHWPTYSQQCDLHDPYLKFLVLRNLQDDFLGYISLDYC